MFGCCFYVLVDVVIGYWIGIGVYVECGGCFLCDKGDVGGCDFDVFG